MVDTTAVIVAGMAALPPTLVAYLAYRTAADARAAAAIAAYAAAEADLKAVKAAMESDTKLKQVEFKIDGRLTELLRATGREQHAAGMVEGRGEQAQLQVQAAMPTGIQEVTITEGPVPVTIVDPNPEAEE